MVLLLLVFLEKGEPRRRGEEGNTFHWGWNRLSLSLPRPRTHTRCPAFMSSIDDENILFISSCTFCFLFFYGNVYVGAQIKLLELLFY